MIYNKLGAAYHKVVRGEAVSALARKYGSAIQRNSGMGTGYIRIIQLLFGMYFMLNIEYKFINAKKLNTVCEFFIVKLFNSGIRIFLSYLNKIENIRY